VIVRFSGFGGQGIVLSGYLFGNAAVLDGKNAVQTQSYGSESRGGACRSDVVISDSSIHELAPVDVDVLVSLSQSAYEKYRDDLKSKGLLVVDDDLVTIDEKFEKSKKVKYYSLSATDIAFKKFGRKIMGNVVMLGYITAITKILSKNSVKKIIKSNVPKGTEDINIKAFEEGYKLGLKEVSGKAGRSQKKGRRKKA
jgi:2-oxoglutarate ferredoxin oxidoreductase subunit gamma